MVIGGHFIQPLTSVFSKVQNILFLAALSEKMRKLKYMFTIEVAFKGAFVKGSIVFRGV